MYTAEHRRHRRQGGSAAAKPVTGIALSSIAIYQLGLQRYKLFVNIPNNTQEFIMTPPAAPEGSLGFAAWIVQEYGYC